MTSVEGRVSSGKQERQNTKNRAWYFPLDPPDTSFSPRPSTLDSVTGAKIPILADLVEAPALDLPRLESRFLPWLRDARYSAAPRLVAQAESRSQGHRAPCATGA